MPEANVPAAATKPAATPEKPSSSSSDRKPRIGDRVWYRDYSGDRPAIVAHVHAGEGTLTLSVLGANGTHYVKDRIARDVERNDGGIKIQGMWHFPEPGDAWY